MSGNVGVLVQNGGFSVRAYRGDAKTLLAFNFADKKSAKNLAGFTIQCTPQGQPSYYIHNTLHFETPTDHAQDASQPPQASINAPIHKFRWLHVPGSVHQGLKPFFGPYTYTVTPRYFDDAHSLQPLDAGRSVAVTIPVGGFSKGDLELGFTRGFVQSQAFGNHFGPKAIIQPKSKDLVFDTTQEAGANAKGEHYTFEQEYEWLGFTAREKILAILHEVRDDPHLSVDVFAYDLNEPGVVAALLKIGKRARVILDNAALHHAAPSKKPKPSAAATKAKKPVGPTPEDRFEKLFAKAAGKSQIKRGHFSRYSHDKVFVVYRGTAPREPVKVMTGSTNFSVTGLYVNANHVLVFNDATVAGFYASVFQQSWDDDTSTPKFAASDWATQPHESTSATIPKTTFNFSPHDEARATSLMGGIVQRIGQEKSANGRIGSVIFAVMEMGSKSKSQVYAALRTLHQKQTIFSYGISDNPDGISLFQLGKKTGVLVTGKPAGTVLPPPFNQVPNIGLSHQVHHKFVVCGFNGDDPVVYCGSSNLADLGEQQNGDNLLAIHDADVATVFAIEGLGLVDHFEFLDRSAKGSTTKDKAKVKAKTPPASKQKAAEDAEWFLSTGDGWTKKFFDPNDLHCVDRQLFG